MPGRSSLFQASSCRATTGCFPAPTTAAGERTQTAPRPHHPLAQGRPTPLPALKFRHSPWGGAAALALFKASAAAPPPVSVGSRPRQGCRPRPPHPPTARGALPPLPPSPAGRTAAATTATDRADWVSKTRVKGTGATAGGAVAAARRPPAAVASSGGGACGAPARRSPTGPEPQGNLNLEVLLRSLALRSRSMRLWSRDRIRTGHSGKLERGLPEPSHSFWNSPDGTRDSLDHGKADQ